MPLEFPFNFTRKNLPENPPHPSSPVCLSSRPFYLQWPMNTASGSGLHDRACPARAHCPLPAGSPANPFEALPDSPAGEAGSGAESGALCRAAEPWEGRRQDGGRAARCGALTGRPLCRALAASPLTAPSTGRGRTADGHQLIDHVYGPTSSWPEESAGEPKPRRSPTSPSGN